MLFSEQNQSSNNQSLNKEPVSSPVGDALSSKQTIAEPDLQSSSYSFFNTNSAADILTLNNLAYKDPMHKQLHASSNGESAAESADSKANQSTLAAYSLFNKNFTTFVKYSESNIAINMALSSSLKNDSHSMDTTQSTADEELSSTKTNNKELRINDMLAATSLTKDQDNQMESTDAPTLKRQNNCLNQVLTTKSAQNSVTTGEDLEQEETSTTDPNNTKNNSTSIKTNKGISTEHKSKIFCQNSSSSTSSTYSNSSTTSSKASSRTDSNEKPQLAGLQNTSNQISRHHLASNGLNQKYSSSSSSGSSTTSTNGSPSSTAATNNANVTKTTAVWNIENELIKYTKNLKLTNRPYTDMYKLGSHIRNGGFSEIYEGNHHLRLNQKVIIKLIPKRKTKNWLMVHNKKYPAEILLHKMCNHINGVVEMTEFFEQEHDWIIIMPKIENCMDLFDFLESKQRGRLSEEEACHFFCQLVRINIDLLNHGVVHRDIKSENILVDLNTMQLILIDFGASAICRTKVGTNVSTQHHYTDFHGTRQYKPPEYIKNKKYTALASTIWTLGILLFDMCNGQLPFETEKEIIEYNLQMKAPVSDEYKILLNDCLKINPLERPTLNQLLEYQWCVNNSKADIKSFI